MPPLSIVIITKNEENILASCISRARLISNDILIIDSGSTDQTLSIAEHLGCRVFKESWEGYGLNKNKGLAKAAHDWILSLDADEVPDLQLIQGIQQLKLDDPKQVYDIRFQVYVGQQAIQYGNLGHEHHIRLFNRKFVHWSEHLVHERLILPPSAKKKQLSGYIHHYTVKDIQEYAAKTHLYTQLAIQQTQQNKKRIPWFKRHLSPTSGFIKNYLLRLGFLDGKEGWQIARIHYRYTQLKYRPTGVGLTSWEN